MQRTKALGLLHKQIKKDSCMSRMGIPDYVVTFRKPGENPQRVTHTNETYPVSHWQEVASPVWNEYASPVWWDINQSDTLNRSGAKDENDEKHIAPLQLPVIERCVELWSNPGDVVLDPFNGIGSTGYQAVKMGRKYVGVELKESYYNLAVKNLRQAEREANMEMQSLFDVL
jgi:DNA modification methylase